MFVVLELVALRSKPLVFCVLQIMLLLLVFALLNSMLKQLLPCFFNLALFSVDISLAAIVCGERKSQCCALAAASFVSGLFSPYRLYLFSGFHLEEV